MESPQQSENEVADNKNDCGALNRPYKALFHWDSQKEKIDRQFVKNQVLERLDPFSTGVFFEFDVLPLSKVEHVSSKAVVDLYDDETTADDYTDYCDRMV